MSKPLQIPLPGGSGLAHTGAIQFQNDWPGLFIRGDHAIAVAAAIRHLQAKLSTDTDNDTVYSLEWLTKIADIVERDVKVGKISN